jgi:hypothetical protein
MMPFRALRVVILLAASASFAGAQSPADGLLMPKRTLGAGVVYTHDSWEEYWEGTLKRSNGNIGTLTTQSITLAAGYGVTDRLNVMAMLPYVWTHASQGVLSDMSGVQDLTFAAKYKVVATGAGNAGVFSAFVVGEAAVPVSDYTPDFYPLSIGTGGGRASGRLTLNYQSKSAWFANASTAYTWCSNVRLNRNSYYTDGQLYLTDEVKMPNVLQSSITAGYRRGRLQIPVSLMQHNTLGGGDIRRQDMPFVSNNMDLVRLDGAVEYALPKNLSVKLGVARVLSGRNVGESTSFTSGLFYAHRF